MRSEDTIEVVIIHLSHCSNIFSIFLVVSRPLFGQLQCHIVGDIVILHPHSSDLTLQANPTLGWFLIWELSIVGYPMKYNSNINVLILLVEAPSSPMKYSKRVSSWKWFKNCELHVITIAIICFLWITDGKVPFRLEKYLFVYANALISSYFWFSDSWNWIHFLGTCHIFEYPSKWRHMGTTNLDFTGRSRRSSSPLIPSGTSSSPWCKWPIEIDGLPFLKTVIFHGKLLVITR